MKRPSSHKSPGSAVAIVGIGGLFPGTPGLDGFWADIVARRSAAREVPAGRWVLRPEDAFDPVAGAPDKTASRRGCYIDSFAPDPRGLRLDEAALQALDPVFHFALGAGRMAFDDAVPDPKLDRRRVGVILGNIALPTDLFSAFSRRVLWPKLAERIPALAPDAGPPVSALNRFAAGLPASVLARALGLGGACFTLDAACASSLYALKLAVEELLAGRADAMLAGGVSRPDCLYTQMGFSQLRALSPSGRCSAFDAAADGLVVGEGAGVFLLKRLSDAERAGDRIYAVVRGIGLSNDIDGSLLAPEGGGQLRAMRSAYAQAGWEPADVDLVECHATGTPVGDAAEFRSLQTLWGGEGWRPGQCAIGSVKSNVGHLLTAAGAAGLMKVLLGLKNRTLPPSANYSRPGSRIAVEGSPFRVQAEAAPWPVRAEGVARKAAVSAFGFGGINAHVLIEEHLPATVRPRARAAKARGPEGSRRPVAIVGMDARFGKALGLRPFQEAVLSGQGAPKASETALPAEGARSPASGQIPDPEIPALAFRIPPRELSQMLPQQVLMLQAAEAALRDAGASGRDHERTGVFIGMELDTRTADFHLRWAAPEALRDGVGPPLSADRTMGALGGIIASRIAREFRIGGPSFTIASEEASGLSALHAAVRALQRGELDMALAGAVDLPADDRSRAAFEAAYGCPASGTAAPFDRDANGSPLGEGAAAVVLKRLDDALADGDRVYAVVRGIGCARPYGAALESAYEDAGVPSGSVSYLEGHGSGIPAQDEAEAEALAGFFGPSKTPRLALGSVKAVLGNTGAASGMASLVKAALALYQEILPPLALRQARDEFRHAGERFHAPRVPQYWFRNQEDGPRRAGVSAMGLGGNCVHAVLEALDRQADPVKTAFERSQPLGARGEGLFTVEADAPRALAAGAARLRSWLGEQPGARGIEALARAWFAARPADSQRRKLGIAFVPRSREELAEQLALAERSLIQDPASPIRGMGRIFYSPEPVGPAGKTAFVFPGSGNQHIGMGLGVSTQWPEVLRRQDEQNARLKDQFRPDLFAPWRSSWPDGWEDQALEKIGHDHRGMIMGQVCRGVVLSDLVRSLGVEPEGVIGYSLGETAGLFALRAWKDRDEMLRRMERSSLFVSELAGRCDAARKAWGLGSHEAVDWAIGVVDRPEKVVRAAAAKLDRVFLLIVNTPSECVVGGSRQAVMKLAAGLGATFLPLDGVTTVHCEVVREVEEAYRELHRMPTEAPAGVRFYSGAWGRSYPVDRRSAAQAVTAQAVDGFDFPAVIERAYKDGFRVFLEMGPRNTTTRMISAILGERPHAARSACVRDQDGASTVLRLAGALVAERVPLNLDALYGFETRVVGHAEPPAALKDAIVVPIHRGLPPGQGRPPVAPKTPEAALPRETARPVEAKRPVPDRPLAAPRGPARAPAHPVLASIAAAQAATLKAHEAYLRMAEGNAMARLKILTMMASRPAQGAGAGTAALEVPKGPSGKHVFMDRDACLRFAVGAIGETLGAAFSPVDEHPTRVRLPAEPLMLVDRIVSVSGEPLSMTSGGVVTEHDVLPGAWYLDGGRVPTCIAVEAGQADLFLSGYLGIDFKTRGRAMYRLLDAVVTFHRGLPVPGDVIRYDIRILRFARQGDTYIFFFEFESTLNGEPLLSMSKGCAGFFTPSQLQEGKGLVFTELDRRPAPGRRPADWKAPVAMKREAFDDKALEALRAGDLAGAFGPAFSGLGLAEPLRLPGREGRMRLVDRVLELDPEGGRYGLGLIRAEADIHPDDWFLVCHFIDDQVMPGTLMYECCLHTLRVFLLRMGWVGEASNCWYEPVPGVASKLKCRGQVLPTTKKATYEISIKEFGYGPEPYAIADALMYSDGKPVVLITDMSVRVSGLTREAVEEVWEKRGRPRGAALFGPESILAFAVGKPSEAFGRRYKVFDSDRVIARLPGPPYQFLDRVTDIRDCRPWELEAGARIEAEYDVPPDAWYFRANRQAGMPFAVLLEIALQPCGWLAAYLGSALRSETDLSFRNLGGKAVLHEEVLPDAGTLTTRIKLTKVSQSVGMIIQSYDMETLRGGRLVYKGDTYFGFFSKRALAEQKGILGIGPAAPAGRGAKTIAVEDLAPRTPEDRSVSPADSLAMPGRALRMFDSVEAYDPAGGPHGLGYIRGVKRVDPAEWFFKAHFYQDPVCPGSLGLESFLQLLKLLALERWSAPVGARFSPMAIGRPHEWVYRGQVVPSNKRVEVEVVVTKSDDAARLLVADGFLRVDGLVIYQMKNFSLEAAGV